LGTNRVPETRNLTVTDREVFCHAHSSEALYVHVVEQHRLIVVTEFGEKGHMRGHAPERRDRLRE
jgi:hypothetical protein